jgi:hypothetical protein
MIEDACIDKTPERHEFTIKLYKDYLYQVCTLSEVKMHIANL